MRNAREQRLVVATVVGIAVDGRTAEMGPMIAFLQRHEFGALRLAIDLVVLAGKPQAGLHGIRAARGEEGSAEAVFLEPLSQFVRQFDQRRIGGAAKGGIIREFLELVTDGLFDRIAGIAEVDVPEPPTPSSTVLPSISVISTPEAALMMRGGLANMSAGCAIGCQT